MMRHLLSTCLRRTVPILVLIAAASGLLGCSSDDTIIPFGPTVTRTFAPTRTPTPTVPPQEGA